MIDFKHAQSTTEFLSPEAAVPGPPSSSTPPPRPRPLPASLPRLISQHAVFIIFYHRVYFFSPDGLPPSARSGPLAKLTTDLQRSLPRTCLPV